MNTDNKSVSKTPIKDHIELLSSQHKIIYKETDLDRFGNTITRLSGDDVILDDTQNLLIALARAKKITSKEMLDLLVQYIQEKKAIKND